MSSLAQSDLVCFSHLRWRWVYQRPQHLLTRAARDRRVFVLEEPEFAGDAPSFTRESVAPGVTVIRPSLPVGTGDVDGVTLQREILDRWLEEDGVEPGTLWYYTPQALPFSSHVQAALTVYDCMDELTLFAGARPELRLLERQLLARSSVVFTGGYSLYEAKRRLHSNVHPMPSSVDRAHFCAARTLPRDPLDHAGIPRPRIGYSGVIDERLDLDLIAGIADARPDWHQVFVGPVTKIAPSSLPQRPNIHYLGGRDYAALPDALAAWDVGSMPFALNDATRYISPTKTPEYLAAGLPVVSTPILDVVRSWGADGLAHIAESVETYVAAIQASLAEDASARLAKVDRILAEDSWDITWNRMQAAMSRAVARVA
ncbi:MAG: glycosyltransferase [Cytophagaceae bacterium]|nr:glycosyltransferase [Gemmatimonadaceae bacterium]